MKTIRVCFLAGAAIAAFAWRADAQDGAPYKLQEINFDMWCQEERHLPPERCDKRLPQDDADFEAYVATIEKYEIPYLQRREQEENLNRVILHSDPIDHPTTVSTPPVNQPSPQD